MSATLDTVTLEGIHFKKGGGFVRADLPFAPESGAYGAQWDAETLSLTYKTPAIEEGGEPTEHTETLTQQQIDDALAAILSPKRLSLEQIKAEAGRRILALIPDWKQRNYIARDAEITKIIVSGGSLTAEQQAERTAIEAVWEQAKAIRSASDAIELYNPLPANIQELQTAFDNELS